MNNIEEKLKIIISHSLKKISEFDGYEKFKGVSNSQDFKNLMQSDPAFAPFCLDRNKYVVARIGGNLITSIHRKIGDLYEDILLELLKDKYGFSKEYLKFSLDIVIDGKEQKRTTDGRLLLSDIENSVLKNKVNNLILDGYDGLAMEVRSCYQIGDSKRIQADDHMATALKAINIEPKLIILCNTSLKSPVKRLSKNWTVYEGIDSFEYIKNLTDFDLYQFLMDNKILIEPLMDDVFDML
jgi:hypothetical protein